MRAHDSILHTVPTAVTSHAQMPSRNGPQLGKSDGGSTTKLSPKRFRIVSHDTEVRYRSMVEQGWRLSPCLFFLFSRQNPNSLNLIVKIKTTVEYFKLVLQKTVARPMMHCAPTPSQTPVQNQHPRWHCQALTPNQQ